MAYIFIIVSVLACQNIEESHKVASDEALCNCVGINDKGEWDGYLTEDCIENYKSRFGKDVDEMHEWFLANCPNYKLKKAKPTLQI